MLSHDNNTKWNSWLTMLKLTIKLKNIIYVFINKNWDFIRRDNLSCNKWDTIYKTITILNPFKDTIKSLKSNLITLDKVLQSIDFLIKHFKS
jgi:hypothetical protein